MEYIDNLFNVLNSADCTDNNGIPVEFDLIFDRMVQQAEKRRHSGKIISIGNGGSAAIASHTTNDFCKNAGIPALCFSDYAVLTCFSNDYGYASAYKEAVSLLASPGDLLIAISSSGKSENILNAVSGAREKGLFTITLSGFDKDNPLRKMGDINIYIPSAHYGMVELGHQIILHMLTDTVKGGGSF